MTIHVNAANVGRASLTNCAVVDDEKWS